MRKKKEPYLRVRVPDDLLPLPREGFLVCSGVGLKPWRRCHWQGRGVHPSRAHAHVFYERLDQEEGRAVLDLSNERLQIIDEDGALVQCIEMEERLLA